MNKYSFTQLFGLFSAALMHQSQPRNLSTGGGRVGKGGGNQTRCPSRPPYHSYWAELGVKCHNRAGTKLTKRFGKNHHLMVRGW